MLPSLFYPTSLNPTLIVRRHQHYSYVCALFHPHSLFTCCKPSDIPILYKQLNKSSMEHIPRAQLRSCMLLESCLGFVYEHVCATCVSTCTGDTCTIINFQFCKKRKDLMLYRYYLQPLCVFYLLPIVTILIISCHHSY